jgi:hypothetical protein
MRKQVDRNSPAFSIHPFVWYRDNEVTLVLIALTGILIAPA